MPYRYYFGDAAKEHMARLEKEGEAGKLRKAKQEITKLRSQIKDLQAREPEVVVREVVVTEQVPAGESVPATGSSPVARWAGWAVAAGLGAWEIGSRLL